MKACPYLGEGEHEHWIKDTLSWHINTIVALLASMYPCLKRFWLTDNCDNDHLLFLAQKIDQANRLDSGSPHALSKLPYVEGGGGTSDFFTTMEPFEPLSALPCMRSYKGRYNYHETPWAPPEKKSTITCLELNECMIHVAALRSALSGIGKLQIFTYEYYWAWDGLSSESRRNGWERDWRVGEIILSLLESAGHSLVELDLTRNGSSEQQRAKEARERARTGCGELRAYEDVENDNDESDGTVKLFMGSHRGFQVFKYVRVQNEAFVEEDSEDSVNSASARIVHRLVDLLPAMVETITLTTPRLSRKDSYQLLESFPELKEERVPKLKKFKFESDKPNNNKPYKEMEMKFYARGIKLVL